LPAVAPFLGSSGREVASEPEVRAIREHLDACAGPGRESGARIDVALSLHSIGRQVLYSFGGRWRAPHDVARLRAAAEAVRDRLESARGVEHGYRARQCARWVPGAFAYGMEIDDLYARYGATALLVECSRGGASWRDPASLVHPFRWFNPRERAVVVRELVAALEPFVRGATSEGRR